MNIVNSLYEKYLFEQVRKYPAPEHISLVLSESDLLQKEGFKHLNEYISWCMQIGVRVTSIHIDVLDTEEELKSKMIEKIIIKLQDFLSRDEKGVGYELYRENGKLCTKKYGNELQVYISVDLGGRKEVTMAVTSILHEVKEGKIKPSQISEKDIESRLVVKHEPDLFIRSGGKHLSDFLIWQSIYSEYYFTDVNWHSIRKLDMLRIVRDFQKRQRRFGK